MYDDNQLHMILFTFEDGTTAAGIGTTPAEAQTWLRAVAIPPYTVMPVTRFEDYTEMSAERKAEVAAQHDLVNYEAPCPACGKVHTCEPWAIETCVDCRLGARCCPTCGQPLPVMP
jgi:hypothetical protein